MLNSARSQIAATSLFIALLLFIESLRAQLSYSLSLFDFDRYQVFEAATQLLRTGIPKITYVPHSSVALDLIYWSHHLLAYIYAFFIAQFHLSSQSLELVAYLELLLIVLLIQRLLSKFVSARVTLVLLAIILLDPAFHFIFVEKLLYRWSYIFALLSLNCLAAVDSGQQKSRIFAVLAGVLLVASPLSFISLGLPIALTGLLFIASKYWNDTGNGFPRGFYAWFLLGFALLPLSIGIYLVANLAPGIFSQLLTSVSAYGKGVSVDGAHGLAARAEFLFALCLGDERGSIFPALILSLVYNTRIHSSLDRSENFAVTYAKTAVMVWIGCALVVPSHFYAARLAWSLPLLLLSSAISIKHRTARPKEFQFLTALAIGFCALSVLNVISYRFGLTPISLVIACVVLNVIAVFLALSTRIFEFRSLALFAALVGLPILMSTLGENLQLAKFWYQARKPISSEPDLAVLAESFRKQSVLELQGVTRIVTNFPVAELFPDTASLQIIFFYRGLFSGARSSPGEKLVLFTSQNIGQQGSFGQVNLGQTLYYRGYCYMPRQLLPLPANYQAFIGDPIACPVDGNFVRARGEVRDEVLREYLQWRASQGLSNS